MAEGNGLLNRRTGITRTAGSNPALSAKQAGSPFGAASLFFRGTQNGPPRFHQKTREPNGSRVFEVIAD